MLDNEKLTPTKLRRSSHGVGTMWESWALKSKAPWEDRGNLVGAYCRAGRRKNNDHHGASPRTTENDPNQRA